MAKKNLIFLIVFTFAILATIFLVYKPWNKLDKISNALFPKTESFRIIDKKITEKNKLFEINISYPQIAGLNDFNKQIKQIIETEIETFKKFAGETNNLIKNEQPVFVEGLPSGENIIDVERDGLYELIINYEKGQIDNELVSIMLNVYSYTGGANGVAYFIPLNYNVKYKSNIKLSEVMLGDPDYLQKISDFCKKDLAKQIINILGDTNGTWIDEGASPLEKNFSNFLITNDNIVFYFSKYQVAFGAAGDFKVIMPRPK